MINRIKPITRHPRFITSVKRLTILVMVLAFIYGVSSAIIVGSSPESLGLPEFYTDNSNSVAYNNVAYVEDNPLDNHYLDIFVPQSEGSERPPVFIWFHGGAWLFGTKADIPTSLVTELLDNGVAVVTANYRLSYEEPYPAAVHDGKTVLRFIRANAEKYGLDAERIIVGGFSSGGHTAAMLALTLNNPDIEDLSQGYADYAGGSVDGVAVLSTPVDFTIEADITALLNIASLPSWGFPSFGALSHCFSFEKCPDVLEEASPLTHVSEEAPPFYIQHDVLDYAVPISQAYKLCRTLLDNHVDCHLNAIDRADHRPQYSPEILDFVAGAFGLQLAD